MNLADFFVHTEATGPDFLLNLKGEIYKKEKNVVKNLCFSLFYTNLCGDIIFSSNKICLILIYYGNVIYLYRQLY